MKTQEEIEKLAEKEYREYPNNPLDEPAWHYNKDIHCHKKRKAFINGYTQYQEDNKDKKYTDEDVIKAINLARKTIVNKWGANGEESIDFVHSNTKIMQSLNKQD